MNEQFEIVIVGGGQSGLALSKILKSEHKDHIVLEASSKPGEAWRNQRWDSFCLVTPNWHIRMPDHGIQITDPDGFLTRDEIVSYLENYAHNLPVQYNQRVMKVEPLSNGFRYRVETTDGSIEANQVIIATGAYQFAAFPSFAQDISPKIHQIHASQYRNPAQLPSGAILVVGSGQSGCQIAEELYQSGRKVYLSVGRAGRIPRRYRGKDIIWWLDQLGFFDFSVHKLPGPEDRFRANPYLSGKDGGHDINLVLFARDGVSLTGHIQGGDDVHLRFAPDLNENLCKADRFEADMLAAIDQWIAESGVDAPLEEWTPPKLSGRTEEIEQLDLNRAGIKTILWSNGFGFDYSLVKLPVFDEWGLPIQTRGITSFPGLYFLGTLWQNKRKSHLLAGVEEETKFLAEVICSI